MTGAMTDLGERNVCNLCNHSEFELLLVIPQLQRKIVKCKNCNLAVVNSANSSFATVDFEDPQEREQKYRQMRQMAEKKGKHDENIINLEQDVRTLHFNRRKQEIERYVKTGRLLDVGCGRGFFLANFVDSNMDYLGVEPRKRICEEAKKRVGENKMFCGTLKEVNLPDLYFDVVTMINLFEHLSLPKETLEEVNRIMKHNGLLYLETPNLGSFIPRILGKRWHAFLEPEHHFFFSRDTLTEMLARTGFKVKEVKKGNKLFSIRYLLYRLSWYSNKLSVHLERIFERIHALNRTIRIPQPDELIAIAVKVTDLRRKTHCSSDWKP